MWQDNQMTGGIKTSCNDVLCCGRETSLSHKCDETDNLKRTAGFLKLKTIKEDQVFQK